jgi:dGTPase
MENPLSQETYETRTEEKTHPIRGEFFRDQTAIIHSMPFRRLKHKTQVFFAPENDHVCTRIEHVMHVATIGATICKGLNKYGWNLNSEMAFAIGLGHDLGHAPFGHAGETALNRKLNGDYKFIHEVNSYRVVEYLANGGTGLNLTYGVKDGIINHNGESFEQFLKPTTQKNDLEKILDRKSISSSYEGCIVRFSDKIAYLGRDIEDALIADIIEINEVPEKIRNEVGETNGQIIDMLVRDLIENSKDSDKINFSDELFEKLVILKNFNYRNIYLHPIIMHYRKMGEKILEELFDYLLDIHSKYGENYYKYQESKILLVNRFGRYIERMREFYHNHGNVPKIIICDYIAGMTDNFALEAMRQIKIPEPLRFK